MGIYVVWVWLTAQVARLWHWWVGEKTPSSPAAVSDSPAEPVGRPPYGRLSEQMVWEYWHPDHAPDEVFPRFLDPWEIDRRLKKFGNGDQWSEALTILRSSQAVADNPQAAALMGQAMEQRQKAFADLAKLSRQVFDLDTVEAQGRMGWTDGSAFLLLHDYLLAIAQLGSEFLPLPKSLARPAG